MTEKTKTKAHDREWAERERKLKQENYMTRKGRKQRKVRDREKTKTWNQEHDEKNMATEGRRNGYMIRNGERKIYGKNK